MKEIQADQMHCQALKRENSVSDTGLVSMIDDSDGNHIYLVPIFTNMRYIVVEKKLADLPMLL